jgi:excisionase family DNA binding protein
MGEDLLTVDETSKRLKIHKVTLRKMLRDGVIRGMKLGVREWRVPESSLREFIESRMSKKPPGSEGPPPKEVDRRGVRD